MVSRCSAIQPLASSRIDGSTNAYSSREAGSLVNTSDSESDETLDPSRIEHREVRRIAASRTGPVAHPLGAELLPRRVRDHPHGQRARADVVGLAVIGDAEVVAFDDSSSRIMARSGSVAGRSAKGSQHLVVGQHQVWPDAGSAACDQMGLKKSSPRRSRSCWDWMLSWKSSPVQTRIPSRERAPSRQAAGARAAGPSAAYRLPRPARRVRSPRSRPSCPPPTARTTRR